MKIYVFDNELIKEGDDDLTGAVNCGNCAADAIPALGTGPNGAFSP